jgi:hypothetical protein
VIFFLTPRADKSEVTTELRRCGCSVADPIGVNITADRAARRIDGEQHGVVNAGRWLEIIGEGDGRKNASGDHRQRPATP